MGVEFIQWYTRNNLGILILTNQAIGEFTLVLTVGFYICSYGIISIAEYFYFRQFCQLEDK